MVNTMMNKKGFSLVEVLIATIVMSMVMGSVLTFVQYAGNIWSKGQEEVDAKNYSRATLELVKDDLLRATSVDVADDQSYIKFKLSDTDPELTFKINSERNGSRSLIKAPVNGGESSKIRIARNIKEFKVTKLSKRTFEIRLVIQKEQSDDEILDGVEPEILSDETMVFIAPGID